MASSSDYWRTRLGFDTSDDVHPSTHGSGRTTLPHSTHQHGHTHHNSQPQSHSAPPATNNFSVGMTTVFGSSGISADNQAVAASSPAHLHHAYLPSVREANNTNTNANLPKRRYSSQPPTAGGANGNNQQRSMATAGGSPSNQNPVATSAYYHFLGGGNNNNISPMTVALSGNVNNLNSSPQSSARNNQHALSNSGTFGTSMNSIAAAGGLRGCLPTPTNPTAGVSAGHRLSIGDNSNVLFRQNTLGPLKNTAHANAASGGLMPSTPTAYNSTTNTAFLHNTAAYNVSGGDNNSSAISTARGDGGNSFKGGSMASLPAADPPHIHGMKGNTNNHFVSDNGVGAMEDDEMERVLEEDFGGSQNPRNNNNNIDRASGNISPTFLGNRSASNHGLIDPGKIGRSASRALVPPMNGRRSEKGSNGGLKGNNTGGGSGAYYYSSTTSTPPTHANYLPGVSQGQLEEEEQALTRRLEELSNRVGAKREMLTEKQRRQQTRDAREVDRILTSKKEEAELLVHQQKEDAALAARKKREHGINSMRRELLRALKKKGVFTMSNAAVLSAATRLVDEDEAAAEREAQRIAALKEKEANAFGGGVGSTQRSSAFSGPFSGKQRTSLTGTLNDSSYNNTAAYRKLLGSDIDGDVPPSAGGLTSTFRTSAEIIADPHHADAARQREAIGTKLVAYLDEFLIAKYGDAIVVGPSLSTIGENTPAAVQSSTSPTGAGRARSYSLRNGLGVPPPQQQQRGSIFAHTQRTVAYDKIMILDDDDEDIGLNNDRSAGGHHHGTHHRGGVKKVESLTTMSNATSQQQSPTDASLPHFNASHTATQKNLLPTTARRRSISSSSSSSSSDETDNSSFSSLEGALVTALSMPRSTSAIVNANNNGSAGGGGGGGTRFGRRANTNNNPNGGSSFTGNNSPSNAPLFSSSSTVPQGAGARASFSVAGYGGLLPRRRSVSPSAGRDRLSGGEGHNGSPSNLGFDSPRGDSASAQAQAAQNQNNPILSVTTAYDLTYFDEEKMKRFADVAEKAEALKAKKLRIANGEELEDEADKEKDGGAGGVQTEIIVDEDGFISEVVVSSSTNSKSAAADFIGIGRPLSAASTSSVGAVAAASGRDILLGSSAGARNLLLSEDHPLKDGGSDFGFSRPTSAATTSSAYHHTNRSTNISVAEAGRQRRAQMRQMEQQAEAERTRAISDEEIKQILKKIKYRQRRTVILTEISKQLEANVALMVANNKSAVDGINKTDGYASGDGMKNARSDYLRGKYDTTIGSTNNENNATDGGRSSSVISDYFSKRSGNIQAARSGDRNQQGENDDNKPEPVSLVSIVRTAIATASKHSAAKKEASKRAMKAAKRKLLDEGLVEDSRVVATSKRPGPMTASMDSTKSKPEAADPAAVENDPYEFLTQLERKFIDIVRKQRKDIKNELYEAERQLRRQEGKNRRRIGAMNSLVGAYESRLAAEDAQRQRIADEIYQQEQLFLRKQKKERLVFWNSYISDIVQKIAEEEAEELEYLLNYRAASSEQASNALWRQRTYDEISANPTKKKELLSKVSSFEVPLAVLTALQSQLATLFPHIPAFANVHEQSQIGGKTSASKAAALDKDGRKKSIGFGNVSGLMPTNGAGETIFAQSANSDDPSLFLANASNVSNVPSEGEQPSPNRVASLQALLLLKKASTAAFEVEAKAEGAKPAHPQDASEEVDGRTDAAQILGDGQPLYLTPVEWRTLRGTVDAYQRHLLTILHNAKINSANNATNLFIGESSSNPVPLSFLSGAGAGNNIAPNPISDSGRGFSINNQQATNQFVVGPVVTPRRNNSDSVSVTSISQAASKASSPSRGDLNNNNSIFGFNNTRTYPGGSRTSDASTAAAASPNMLNAQQLRDFNSQQQPMNFMPNRHAGRNNSNAPSTASTPSISQQQHQQAQLGAAQGAPTPDQFFSQLPIDAAAAEAIIASLNMHLGMGGSPQQPPQQSQSGTSLSFLSGSVSGVGSHMNNNNIAANGLPSQSLQVVRVIESIDVDRFDFLIGTYLAHQRSLKLAAAAEKRGAGRKVQAQREAGILSEANNGSNTAETREEEDSLPAASPLFFDFKATETDFVDLLATAAFISSLPTTIAASPPALMMAPPSPTRADAFGGADSSTTIANVAGPTASTAALAAPTLDFRSLVSEMLSIANSKDSLEMLWATDTTRPNHAGAILRTGSDIVDNQQVDYEGDDDDEKESGNIISNLADTARRSNSVSQSASLSIADESANKRLSVFCGASSNTVVGAGESVPAGPSSSYVASATTEGAPHIHNGQQQPRTMSLTISQNKSKLKALIANSKRKWSERNRLLDDLAVMSLLTSKLRRLKR